VSFDEPLGEQTGRVRPHRREGVVIAEASCVLAHRVAELGAAVADVDAPEAGHAVDVAASVDVEDARTAAGHDHAWRPCALVLAELRERVEHEAAVGVLGCRGRVDRHGFLP
jgi:hypothetical protein